MTSSPTTARPRGRPLRDVPIEPEVMRRPDPTPEPKESPPTASRKPRKRTPMLTVLTVLMLIMTAVLLFWVIAGVFGAMLKLETITVLWPNGKGEILTDEAVLVAAGLSAGDRLYAINTDAAEEAVLRANPYLASVELECLWPDTVSITCVPRDAAFYLEADGEWFAISTDLVVLEQSRDARTFAERGLVHLILPEVKHAVIGRELVFAEHFDTAYLHPLLSAHRESTLWAETDLLRIDSRFDVRLVVRGSYALTLGGSDDAALKLTLAEKILADSTFSANSGAFLDLSNPAESSAILDKQTDYSLLWRN